MTLPEMMVWGTVQGFGPHDYHRIRIAAKKAGLLEPKPRPVPATDKPTKVCPECGREFVAKPINRKYCTDKCKTVRNRRDSLERYYRGKGETG